MVCKKLLILKKFMPKYMSCIIIQYSEGCQEICITCNCTMCNCCEYESCESCLTSCKNCVKWNNCFEMTLCRSCEYNDHVEYCVSDIECEYCISSGIQETRISNESRKKRFLKKLL